MKKALLAVVLLIGAGCSTAAPSETTSVLEPSSTTTTVPQTTSTTTATTTSPPTTVVETTSTTVDPSLITSGTFSPSFTIRAPEGTSLALGVVSPSYRDWGGPNNSWLIFHRMPRTIEGWAGILTDGGATPGDPVDVPIGGMPARMVEGSTRGSVMVVPNDMAASLPGFLLQSTDTARIYVVDVDGTLVTIFGISSTEDFESWSAVVEETLSTLEWTG